VLRNTKWRKRKQYTFPETSKPPLTRKQKDKLLYPIPRNLTAPLSTNALMEGAHIEEFVSHLVSSNKNMTFIGINFGPGLLHQGHLYWDNFMGTKHILSAQKARDGRMYRNIYCIFCGLLGK
jgi:hypothetical protein